jgi:hypothetical protein
MPISSMSPSITDRRVFLKLTPAFRILFCRHRLISVVEKTMGNPSGASPEDRRYLFDPKPSPRTESLVAAAVHGLPRHYFRYSGLFHKSEYNLNATTTRLPPRGGWPCPTL